MTTTPQTGAAPPPSDVPLACIPEAIPATERPAHFALLARLFGEGARERRELADGYAFRFEADALDDVARFVANERRCCPFLAFTLDLAPEGGPLWLGITGPAGTRAFLDVELPRRPEWTQRGG
jgi:hypothetical protein